MLDKNFLAPYYAKKDPFTSLLARSTYLGKYCRDGETWTDTIARVVLGNLENFPGATREEAEFLFDIFWQGKALPPGRGLWTGGVKGIPVDARYSCHYGTLRSIEDWCWAANMLMCGGGVGVGLQQIDKLSTIVPGNVRLGVLCSKSHPNVGECMPDEFPPQATVRVVVDDSRNGWVSALRTTLTCAVIGMPLVVNVSPIRPRGTPIKTFGGIACGPGPLVQLLRAVWSIIRGAQGRKLTSVECLDITNHIGVCIKSGNVRRSALIVLGNAHDQAFREAKKDWSAVMSHRHSSNNSIVFETEEQIDSFDWRALVEDNAEFGEPGIVNLWKIRETDPLAEGVNPCSEIVLHDREACCLSEVYPALFGENDDANRIFEAVTRYTLRQRLEPMSDAKAEKVRVENMRIGVGLGGICDFPWTQSLLHEYRSAVVSAGHKHARELGVSIPIAFTTVKPSGTISLLNGSSPGIHAPFAPFYIRRTRIGVDEPMAQALVEAGVPNEPCVYDSTGKTLVFSFPTKARHSAVTVQNEGVVEQMTRQLAVQRHWADNAVSTTISFEDWEKADLVEMLQFHAKDLKSISALPKKHGYEQPPYEAIDEATYARLHGQINHGHPLTAGGDLDTMECEAGVCPVK